MKGTALLRERNTQDDQVLETDIMRFMAVIGIVFWIIFALVKSMPFQPQDLPSAALERPEEKTKALSFIPSGEADVEKKKDQKKAASRTKPAQSGTPESKKAVESQKKMDRKILEIHMQFRSLDDLLALMAEGRVRLFCRAESGGFDLYFEGEKTDDDMRFKSAQSLPGKLWEIKSGRAYSHFLELMAQTYPEIRNFTNRQVLVSFADEELRENVESTFSSLKREGKGGTFSITRDGDVVSLSSPHRSVSERDGKGF